MRRWVMLAMTLALGCQTAVAPPAVRNATTERSGDPIVRVVRSADAAMRAGTEPIAWLEVNAEPPPAREGESFFASNATVRPTKIIWRYSLHLHSNVAQPMYLSEEGAQRLDVWLQSGEALSAVDGESRFGRASVDRVIAEWAENRLTFDRVELAKAIRAAIDAIDAATHG